MHMIKNINLTACLCFLLAFAALAIGVWGVKQRSLADEYFSAAGEYMEAQSGSCTRCANELCDNISDMEVSLAKLYASGSQSQTVLALEDIVKSGAAAVSVLSRLPAARVATEDMMTFLVRAGDYSRCLSRRVLAGETLAEGDLSQLESLYNTCSSLAASLSAAVTEGGLAFALPEAGGYYDDEPRNDGFFTKNEDGHDNAETVPEYPALIYDGPFSESTEKAVPHGLGNERITEAEALETACALTGARLEPAGASGGKIPVYLFTGEENGESISAAVTENGGRLLWFMRSIDTEAEQTEPPDEKEYESLVLAASKWLDEAGYKGMTPTYTLYYNGAALISFVYEFGGVRIYNDLVKVWVRRGSLKIIGADANNYLFSHRQRLLPRAVLTADEAKAKASSRLEVDNVSLAVIPLSPLTEALCFELHGTCRGEEYVVYINALNGREEQIFKIINDGNGKAAV